MCNYSVESTVLFCDTDTHRNLQLIHNMDLWNEFTNADFQYIPDDILIINNFYNFLEKWALTKTRRTTRKRRSNIGFLRTGLSTNPSTLHSTFRRRVLSETEWSSIGLPMIWLLELLLWFVSSSGLVWLDIALLTQTSKEYLLELMVIE